MGSYFIWCVIGLAFSQISLSVGEIESSEIGKCDYCYTDRDYNCVGLEYKCSLSKENCQNVTKLSNHIGVAETRIQKGCPKPPDSYKQEDCLQFEKEIKRVTVTLTDRIFQRWKSEIPKNGGACYCKSNFCSDGKSLENEHKFIFILVFGSIFHGYN